MRYPDEDEVREVLEPFEQLLLDLHQRAWDRLVACTEWPTLFFMRTGAVLMHDLVVQEAAKVLDDAAGVRRIGHDKTVWYLVGDRVLLRFKKGTRKGLGSNIDTMANDDFIDAEADLLGMPEVMKVELLWYANKLRTKLDRLIVTARDGKMRLWSYVLGDKPAIGMLPTPMPISPAPVKAAPELVTLKPVKKVEEEDDE